MVRPSSEPGVVLDVDWEKMVEINLPLIKVNRTVTYKGKKIESRQDKMGEMMFIGDSHIGHGSHSGNPLRAHLKFVQDHPHIQIGLMGDYIEYAANTGFVKEETIDIDEQINAFIRLMKPLKDRIAFILWGNHEERFARYTKSNRLMISLAAEIGVSEHCYVADPQRGVFCLIKAGAQTYGSYFQHGATGAIANEFFQQKKTSVNNRVALIGQGHTHKLGSTQLTEKSMEHIGDETAMITRRRWLLNTGCFIKEAGYAEAKSYPYSVVGAPLVRFYANKEKLDVTDLTIDYKDYLTKGGIVFGDPVGVEDFGGFWKNAGMKNIPLKYLKVEKNKKLLAEKELTNIFIPDQAFDKNQLKNDVLIAMENGLREYHLKKSRIYRRKNRIKVILSNQENPLLGINNELSDDDKLEIKIIKERQKQEQLQNNGNIKYESNLEIAKYISAMIKKPKKEN